MQPFHEGELEVQRLAGQSERARATGRAIAGRIPAGALRFIGQQPFLIAAALDGAGRPRCGIAAGPPGFVRAPSEGELLVDGARLALLPADLRAHLAADERIGLLFIEPASRRRLRVNGAARLLPDGGLAVRVLQSFPNCPQYVRVRAPAGGDGGPAAAARWSSGAGLSPELRACVRRADVFFVASRGPDGLLDVSHRGGEPGFVQVSEEGALRIPDYQGNSMFNTLGNLLRDPRASLLFADFERGDVLELTGRAALDFGPPGSDARAWTFAPEQWLLGADALPFRLVRLE
jgi:predicted pyridoxine 5'-phosphate oxidase superfamily flavin-nucleotide-binding protein